MDRDQRLKLVAEKVTLNGEPARITGTQNDFATVRQNASGLSCEWAWSTVAHIVANGGAFQS